MNPTRRHILGALPAALALETCFIPFGPVVAQRTKARAKVALLAPLTGPSAAIGLSMQRAALLAQAPGAKADDLIVADTAGGAAAAAKLAVKRGARIIIGPLFAADTRAVLGAVDAAIPVLTLSNDESLAGSGAFLMGITATQSVTAILRYARSRGVRRVAVLSGESPWAARGMAAATSLGAGLGLDIVSVANTPDLPAALRRAGKGELPDALLVTEPGDALRAVAQATTGLNVQLLGSQQSLDRAVPGAAGAWVAGPDPRRMGEFADRYQVRSGGIPGSIAALAFDAANIAELLGRSGAVDRSILLGGTAFPAITGPIRFLADGTATRELAILVAGPDGFTATDRA
ncbi:MAG: hypothetical protein JWR77_607 [Rhizorhabdus sp.]|nr:hypothetical protein [Rhizorhabdus sp.]